MEGSSSSNDCVEDVTDLGKLGEITLQSVLETLVRRFEKGKFCTFAGSVLVAVNPCSLEGEGARHHVLLDTAARKEEVKEFIRLWRNARDLDLKRLRPHVLSFGVKSLYNVEHVGNDQVIVVSGDSGAGKTTCTQDLIKFFTYSDDNEGNHDEITLEKKIYEATLILEALGNASTIANPNSSRFGRLVRLKYNKNCRIEGAEIKTYLLEKHRVAKGNPTERNFHIFHYLLQAIGQGYLDADHKDLFSGEYWAGQCQEADLQKFIRLSTALTILDLLEHFIQVFEFLFAILYLLLVEFVEEESSDEEKENYYSRSCKRFTISDGTRSSLSSACQLLGVNENQLESCFIYHTFSAGNRKSVSLSPCATKEDCEARLHAFISNLYDRLFQHIVSHLNCQLNEEVSKRSASGEELDHSSVSILDLYGFESLECNHFEQLCINYANERIQQIQVSALKGYLEEERRLSDLTSEFEEPVELNRVGAEITLRIEEIHNRLFSVLDEACMLKRPTTDKNVYDQLILGCRNSDFVRPGRPHDPKFQFLVKHYAAPVNYSLTGMITKNKDFIPEEFLSLLNRSKRSFVSELFGNVKEEPPAVLGKIRKPEGRRTILMRFKTSVAGLVNELSETDNRDVHFIKCIRPNSKLTPGVIELDVIKKQLFACGIVDIIRIAGNGYPIRFTVKKFCQEFPLILRGFCKGELQMGRLENIFSFPQTPLRFGESFVFMNEETLRRLHNGEKSIQRRAARKIQKVLNYYLCEMRKRAQMKTPVHEFNETFSSDASVYFTPAASGFGGNSCSSFQSAGSVGPYGDGFHMNASTSSQISPPQESGVWMNSSGEEYNNTKHWYPSLLNGSTTLEGSTTTDCDIISSTLLPMEMDSEFDFLNSSQCERQRSVIGKPLQLYFGDGVVCRAPVHTQPIKLYLKKTALGLMKPPHRLKANGVQDALEEYGLVLHPRLVF